MKVVYSTTVRTFLCAGLLLGSVALTQAQEPAGQQASPAADNSKMNQRDQNAKEPTADQQKDNHSDQDITGKSESRSWPISRCPPTRTMSKSSRKTVKSP